MSMKRSKFDAMHQKKSPVVSFTSIVKGLLVLLLVFLVYFNVTFDWNGKNKAPSVFRAKTDASRKTEKAVEAKVLKKDKRRNKSKKYAIVELNPKYYEEDNGCDFSEFVRDFNPKELPINCDNIMNLTRGEKLGAGFWRKVYAADFQGHPVAVKLVRENLLNRSDNVQRHTQEAAALFAIRKYPNIVPLYGWCNSTVIVDFVPQKLEDLVFHVENPPPLPVKRALELALDAAKGVAQLHGVPGGPLAHTDIQTRQFLIASDGRLLLNDFNRVKYAGWSHVQSSSVDEKVSSSTPQKCTFRTGVAKGKWRAPEEYEGKALDEKVDIFSLAYVLWTFQSRIPPLEEHDREDIYKQVPTGLRPNVELMKDYPQAMQELIIEAWDKDPVKRPSAKEMVQRIEKILEDYE